MVDHFSTTDWQGSKEEVGFPPGSSTLKKGSISRSFFGEYLDFQSFRRKYGLSRLHACNVSIRRPRLSRRITLRRRIDWEYGLSATRMQRSHSKLRITNINLDKNDYISATIWRRDHLVNFSFFLPHPHFILKTNRHSSSLIPKQLRHSSDTFSKRVYNEQCFPFQRMLAKLLTKLSREKASML